MAKCCFSCLLMPFDLIAAFWKNGVEKWETWRIFCQIFTLNVQKHQKFSEKHAYLADFSPKTHQKSTGIWQGWSKKGDMWFWHLPEIRQIPINPLQCYQIWWKCSFWCSEFARYQANSQLAFDWFRANSQMLVVILWHTQADWNVMKSGRFQANFHH